MAYRLDLAICSVIVDEDTEYVETRFSDGSYIGVHSTSSPEASQMAQELGYEDSWAMTLDHEISLSWLAYMDGHVSGEKWAEAHHEEAQLDQEEVEVVEFQKKVNVSRRRPWDHLRKPFHWRTLA